MSVTYSSLAAPASYSAKLSRRHRLAGACRLERRVRPHLRLQAHCHEHTVRIFQVLAERPTVREAETLVESLGWHECFMGASLKAQTFIGSRPSDFNDMSEDRSSRAFATKRGGSAHGLYFAVLAVQFFEGTAAEQERAFPSGPERNLGLAEL